MLPFLLCYLPAVVLVPQLDKDHAGGSAVFGGLLLGFLAASFIYGLFSALWAAAVGLPSAHVVLGLGAFRSSHLRGDLLVVRRGLPLVATTLRPFDPGLPGAVPRYWAAQALTAASMAGSAVAAFAVPGGLGVGLCGAIVLATAAFLGQFQPGAMGWTVFVLPFRGAAAMPPGGTLRKAAWPVFSAASVGDTAAIRAAIAAGTTTAGEAAVLEAGIALTEGRYDDAEALAAGVPPDAEPPATAAAALVRLRAGYYRTMRQESRGTVLLAAGPDVDADRLIAAARTGPMLTLAGDGEALHALHNGDTRAALRHCRIGLRLVSGAAAAAQIHCTAALALARDDRPGDAIRRLAKARRLAPGLPRLADVERALLPESVAPAER